MRGNPILRLLIVIALFAIAALPLWKLTAEKPMAPGPSTLLAPEAISPIQIEVTCSQPATEFAIRHLGKVVWKGSGLQAKTELPLPTESFDLQVEAAWDPVGKNESAFRIRAIRDEMVLMESTFWGHERIEDTLTIPAN